MKHVSCWVKPREGCTGKGDHLYSKWDKPLSEEELANYPHFRDVRVHPRLLGILDVARLFGQFPRGIEFYDDEGNSTVQFVDSPSFVRRLFW